MIHERRYSNRLYIPYYDQYRNFEGEYDLEGLDLVRICKEVQNVPRMNS
jgi:hypothetical protein